MKASGRSPTKSAFLKSLTQSSRENVDASVKNEPVTIFDKHMQIKKEKEDVARRGKINEIVLAKRKVQREKERLLKLERQKLTHKLSIRPRDQKSALKLIDVAYELQDYFSVCTLIHKLYLAHPPLTSNIELNLKLGRCALRSWKKDGTKKYIMEAYDAYSVVMRDPTFITRPQANPVIYLEYVGILIRVNKHQMAVDMLGAMMARWEDNYELLLLLQYILAQISFTRGNVSYALDLYQRLVSIPPLVEPLLEYITDEEHPHIVLLVPAQLISIVIQVEMAAIQNRLGNKKLSIGLFSEAFHRQKKNGDLSITRADNISILFDNKDIEFREWASDHKTYKKLSECLKKLGNVTMAAELSGIASEVYSNNILSQADVEKKVVPSIEMLPKYQKSVLCNHVLDRAECLAEVGDFDGAKSCAHYAYSIMPVDVVVTGRAARCLQSDDPANHQIYEESIKVYQAVSLVARVLHRKVAARRRQARKAMEEFATIINSGIRMALVRNKMVGDLLSVTATRFIAKRLHSFRNVWRTGQQERAQWIEFWNTSCNIIQRGLWRWYIRRQQTKTIRGITSFKRIWRGQKVRRYMRDLLVTIQEELDDGIECGRGQHKLYFDCSLVHRLSAGVIVFTEAMSRKNNDENQSQSNNTSPPFKSRRDIEGSPAYDDEERFASPVGKSNSLEIRASQSQSLFTEYGSTTLVGDASSPLQAKPRSKRIAPPKEEKSPYTKHSLISASMSRSQSDKGTTWFKSDLDIDSIGRNRPSTSSNTETEEGSTLVSSVRSKRVAAPMSSSCVRQEELEDHIEYARTAGEDVISLISYRTTKDDVSMQWIPFSMLPNTELIRLLSATSLSITSPTFDNQCMLRIIYNCKKYPHLWSNIQSLFISGTRLCFGGDSINGVEDLLRSLGLGNLHTLTVTNMGIHAGFGEFLGSLLDDRRKKTRPVALTRIYIEDEPHFGDRGMIGLCKKLQLNSSIRYLSVRNCGLTHKCVQDVARYVSLSSHLEVLSINDNYFSLADCKQLLHSVANKGMKGNFRSLYCLGTNPVLNPIELKALLKEGMRLSVNVVSGDIDVNGVGWRSELELEKQFRDSGVDLELQHQEALTKYVEEVKRLGSIEDLEQISMTGIKAHKAFHV